MSSYTPPEFKWTDASKLDGGRNAFDAIAQRSRDRANMDKTRSTTKTVMWVVITILVIMCLSSSSGAAYYWYSGRM